MLSGFLDILIFITSFLVVLSFLVFFHELGHYSVGRFFGIAVDRFSIGFGKPLARWTAKSGTEWTISRIPLGGYVKFSGDASGASNPDSKALEKIRQDAESKGGEGVKNIFHFRPVWQRALVVLAGPAANFVLAILIFAALALAYGTYDRASVIGDVMPGSAAEQAGLLPGDKILKMDGKDVSTFTSMARYIALKSETAIDVEFERDGRLTELIVSPNRVEQRDFVGGRSSSGVLGVRSSSDADLIHIQYGPIEALGYGVNELGSSLSMTLTYIGRIFTGKESGEQLGSVVKIATITGKSAVDAANADAPFKERMRSLFLRLIQLSAAISIGLGVANLMPIPVLDGGHLVYYAYEAVAGRPLSQEKQELGFRIGFGLLLTVFVLLTINDIGYVSSFFS